MMMVGFHTQTARSNDLNRLEELTKKVTQLCTFCIVLMNVQYEEYEEVVVEYRALKEKQRLKEEQEERERIAATKVCVGLHTVQYITAQLISQYLGLPESFHRQPK